MAAITCKYHPQIPARWSCTHCHINYCMSCTPEPSARGKLPRCTVCDRELSSLGTGNLVKPFWYRLGHMFIYPAYPTPMIFILVMTGLLWLVTKIPIPLFDLVLLLLLSLFFMKYAYSVLEDTAHGHLTPRAMTSETLTDHLSLPLKQILLIIALGGVNVAVYDFFASTTAFWITYFLIILAFPAATMVLAMEHSFFRAFNPLLVSAVIARIGFPYFFMVGLLFLLSIASETILMLLVPLVPKMLINLLVVFVLMYFVIIMFHLMGYVLYQYHEQLGYSIEVEDQAHTQLPLQEQTSPEMRAVEILLQEGKNEEASQRLAQLIAGAPGNIDARERMLKLARMIQNQELHTRQGQDYISYLIHENKPGQAAKVYQACVQFDKNFRPAKPGERVDIARMLRNNGQAKSAVALLNNLHHDFPTFDGIAPAYLLVAQLLCESFGEDGKARQILEFVIKNHPHHPVMDEVGKYLKMIENLKPR